MNKYYVYELVDPRTLRPFYVGKGSGDRDRRHLQEASMPPDKQVNKIKCRVINNLLSLGHQVIINRIATNLSEEEAFTLEQQIIGQHGKLIDGSGILTNISNGGEGGTGTNSKTIYQYTLTGALVEAHESVTKAAESCGVHKSTVCAALNGRTRVAGGFQWRYADERTESYVGRKTTPVDMFSVQGEWLMSFDSIRKAAAHTKVTYTQISECINPNTRKFTAGGFRWAVRGEQPKPLPRSTTFHSTKKQYACYTKDGALVKVFDSINSAVRSTSANRTGIIDCCAGRKFSSGDLVWKYVLPE